MAPRHTAAPTHPPLLGAHAAGVDVSAMLAEMGIDARALEDPAASLPRQTWQAIWEQSVRRAGDPALALRAAAATPLGAFDVVDYVASNEATLADGLRSAVAYFQFARAGFDLALVDDPAGHLIVRRVTAPRPGLALLHQYSTEFTFALLVHRFARSTGSAFVPRRTEFSYAAPAHVTAYVEVFGEAVVFGAPHDQITFDATDLRRRQPNADSRLRDLIERSAAALKHDLPGVEPVTRALRRALPRALGERRATVADVASTLAMSVRTLHRRLEAEGTSFGEVVDEVRFSLSQRYLTHDGLAATEIAYLLGFSSERAFARAFKRWSGVTPSAWRLSSR